MSSGGKGLEGTLAGAGLRPTAVRRAVLAALLAAGAPCTHGRLLERPELRGLDRVTLYRTLHALRRAGLVHAVQGMDGAWRYCAHRPAARGCPGGHPHFLCQACGRMSCLTDQGLPQVSVPPGHRVRGKQLVVYGLCPECAAAAD